jgi:hypothetical protein
MGRERLDPDALCTVLDHGPNDVFGNAITQDGIVLSD